MGFLDKFTNDLQPTNTPVSNGGFLSKFKDDLTPQALGSQLGRRPTAEEYAQKFGNEVETPTPEYIAQKPVFDELGKIAIDAFRSTAEPASTLPPAVKPQIPFQQDKGEIRLPGRGEQGRNWLAEQAAAQNVEMETVRAQHPPQFELVPNKGFKDSEGNQTGVYVDKTTGKEYGTEEIANIAYPKQVSEKPTDYHNITNLPKAVKDQLPIGINPITGQPSIKVQDIFKNIDPKDLTALEEVALYGARNFLNSSLFGTYQLMNPKDFESEPSTGWGKVGAGAASLAGDIPTAFAVSGKLVGLIPTLVKKAGALKASEGVARQALTLGLAQAMPYQGGQTWKEELDKRMEAFKQGAVTGGLFGGVGEVSNFMKDGIARGASAIIGMTLVSGIPSSIRGDTTEEQMYNYLLGTFFGVTHTAKKPAKFEDVEAKPGDNRGQEGYVGDLSKASEGLLLSEETGNVKAEEVRPAGVAQDQVIEQQAGREAVGTTPPETAMGVEKPVEPAKVKVIITKADEAELKRLDWTDEDIYSMRPARESLIIENGIRKEAPVKPETPPAVEKPATLPQPPAEAVKPAEVTKTQGKPVKPPVVKKPTIKGSKGISSDVEAMYEEVKHIESEAKQKRYIRKMPPKNFASKAQMWIADKHPEWKDESVLYYVAGREGIELTPSLADYLGKDIKVAKESLGQLIKEKPAGSKERGIDQIANEFAIEVLHREEMSPEEFVSELLRDYRKYKGEIESYSGTHGYMKGYTTEYFKKVLEKYRKGEDLTPKERGVITYAIKYRKENELGDYTRREPEPIISKTVNSDDIGVEDVETGDIVKTKDDKYEVEKISGGVILKDGETIFVDGFEGGANIPEKAKETVSVIKSYKELAETQGKEAALKTLDKRITSQSSPTVESLNKAKILELINKAKTVKEGDLGGLKGNAQMPVISPKEKALRESGKSVTVGENEAGNLLESEGHKKAEKEVEQAGKAGLFDTTETFDKAKAENTLAELKKELVSLTSQKIKYPRQNEIRVEMEALRKRIKEAESPVTGYESRRPEYEAKRAELKAEVDDLLSRAGKNAGKLNSGVDPQDAIIFGKVAVKYIESGINDIKQVVDYIASKGFEYSKAEIEEAIAKHFTKKEPAVTPEAIRAEIPEAVKKADDTITGIKNRIREKELEEMGLLQVKSGPARPGEKVKSEAQKLVESGEIDPKKLADELANSPRVVTDTEVAILELDGAKIKKEYKLLGEEIIKAHDRGALPEEINLLQAQRELLDDQYVTNSIAARLTGTKSAQSLAFRRWEVSLDDLSLLPLKENSRVKLGVRQLPAELEKKLEDISQKYEEMKTRLDEVEALRLKEQAERLVSDEIAKQAKAEPSTTPVKKEIYKKRIVDKKIKFNALADELNALSENRLSSNIDPKAIVIMGKMTKNLVEQGVIKIEEIVNTIYTAAKERYTKREIMEAISGYSGVASKQKQLSELTELRKRMKLMLQIDDAKKGLRPLKPKSPEHRAKSEEIKKLENDLAIALQDAGIDIKNEAMLRAYKTRSTNRMISLQEAIRTGKPLEGKANKKTVLDQESIDINHKIDKLKEEHELLIFQEKLKSRTPFIKGLDKVRQSMYFARAMKTAYDLSGVLRQGGFIVFGHPIRGIKSFPDMMKALKSEAGQSEVNKSIRENPYYHIAQKSGLYLAEHGKNILIAEEAYMSRWANSRVANWIGVAQSGRAYTAFLNSLRMNSFQIMVKGFAKRYGELPTEKQMENIASYINTATGRGSIGKLKGNILIMNDMFFAPRNLISRFQLMTGQPLWKGDIKSKGDWVVRRMITEDYARYLAGVATVYTLAILASKLAGNDEGEIELANTNSSDWGKLKFGNLRIDALTGLAQTLTLTSKINTNLLFPSNKDIPNFQMNMWKFLRSKLSPTAGTIVNLYMHKDFINQPFGIKDIPKSMAYPMSFENIYDIMTTEYGILPETAVTILAILGTGVQNYAEYNPKPKSYTSAKDDVTN